jgi:hypothetical protein
MTESMIEQRLRSALFEWGESLESAHPIESHYPGARPGPVGVEADMAFSFCGVPPEGSVRHRRPRLDPKPLAVAACAIALIGVVLGIGARHRSASHEPVPATRPGVTAGTIPSYSILRAAASRQPGVTRSALKTVPYRDITLLAVASFSPGTLYNAGRPIGPTDLVDVVALAGSVRPPDATRSYRWMVELVDPSTGQTLAISASSEGAWPPYFDGLPVTPILPEVIIIPPMGQLPTGTWNTPRIVVLNPKTGQVVSPG